MKIKDKEAFFLSRYYHQTALYFQTKSGDWQRFYLSDALRNSNEETAKEFVVRYGAKAQLDCRLIAKRVCDEVAHRRKRKKRQAAKKKGRTISPRSLALCHWDLYVTNIPSSFVPAEYISNLYRIRWQIELVFKGAKSFLGINLWEKVSACVMPNLWTFNCFSINFISFWEIPPANVGTKTQRVKPVKMFSSVTSCCLIYFDLSDG